MFYDKTNMCTTKELETDLRNEHNMQESSIDTLPVVELRPFSKQVWRREKSFPEFYNQPTEMNQDIEQRYFPNDYLPNIVEVLNDITQSSNRIKEDDHKRIKTKLHPKMPNITAAQTGKSWGIISGFITKEDRTKTTLFLAKQEENPKSYSCRKQALNSATTRRQQQLMLNGDPLSLPENMPNQFVYLNPLLHYKQKASLKQMKYRQSKHSSAPSDDRINHITSLPGNELDIIGILQRRSSKPKLRPISVGKRNEDNSDILPRSDHLISSLEFWKKDFKPTIIERQLFFDKAFRLQRCRRNMDIGYTSLELLQQLQNDNNLSRSLTQGEIMLKKGKDSNTTNSKSELDNKVLAPVFEPCKKRSKILSIRKFGSDPVIIPREKVVLAPVLATSKCTLENRRKDSDVSMASENGNQNVDGIHNDSVGSVCVSPSVIPNDTEENNEEIVSTNKEQEAIDQWSAEVETPIKEHNYVTDTFSFTDSPLIDLVAKVNSNASQRLESIPGIEIKGDVFEYSESETVSYVTKQVVNDFFDMKPNINSDLSKILLVSETSTMCNDKTIKRRPKACAYDDEDCDKHKASDETDCDQVVISGDKPIGNYDKEIDNIDEHTKTIIIHNDYEKHNSSHEKGNFDKQIDIVVSQNDPVEKLKNNNGERDNHGDNVNEHINSGEHKDNNDKYNNSDKHSTSNTYTNCDKHNNDDNHSTSHKYISNVKETSESKDKATQVDSDDVVDGNDTNDTTLLLSTTFLTTRV